jgi:hypothetical protein
MKNLYIIAVVFVLLLFPAAANAQVLITLLFGNALNTDKIEFGLAGGMNHSYILDIEGSKAANFFNLGFYFHIKMMPNSYLSTGVQVKSNVGATGMDTYPIGIADFDAVYQDGTLTKKINTFYVPILFQQRFNNNRWYIEAGPQLGLIYKPKDIFEVDVDGGESTYELDIKDNYKHIDAGLYGGVGYKFKKEIKSVSAGIGYYYGLVNVSEVPDLKIKNSSIYFYVRLPIEPKQKEKTDKKDKKDKS